MIYFTLFVCGASLFNSRVCVLQVHAALAAVLYAERPAERQLAEEQWELATEFDKRYGNIDWVVKEKHWGPRLTGALDRFLHLA